MRMWHAALLMVCGAALGPVPCASGAAVLRLHGGGPDRHFHPPPPASAYGDAQQGWGPGPEGASGTLAPLAARNPHEDWRQRGPPPQVDGPAHHGAPYGMPAGAPYGPYGAPPPQHVASGYGSEQGSWAPGGGGRYPTNVGGMAPGMAPALRDGHGGLSGSGGGAYPHSSWGPPGQDRGRYGEQRHWQEQHFAAPPRNNPPQPAPWGGGYDGQGAAQQTGRATADHRQRGWDGGSDGQRRRRVGDQPGDSFHGGGAREWVQRDAWKASPRGRRGVHREGSVPKSELLRRILDSRTRQDLANWILEVKRRSHGGMGAFGAVHVMTSLNRMTKLPPGDSSPRSKARYYGALNSVFGRAKYLRGSLNARGIATVVHAAGALNRNDTEGLQLMLQRGLEEGVRSNFTAMGFSNVVWALGKARFPDADLMGQVLGMVSVSVLPANPTENVAETPMVPVQAHLSIEDFNTMDLCNCMTGISLFRGRDPAAAGTVGAAFFDACLGRACETATAEAMSNVNINQVLEACKILGCLTDARLESLLLQLTTRLEQVPDVAAAAGTEAPLDQDGAGTSAGGVQDEAQARPRTGAVADAAVQAFQGDRRSLIHTWVVACMVAASPAGGPSAAKLAQLLLPAVADPGLLSFARRADVLLLVEALQACRAPSAALAARVVRRALQFDEFTGDEVPHLGLVRFTFAEQLQRIEAMPALDVNNPELTAAMAALRDKVASVKAAGGAKGGAPDGDAGVEEGQAREDDAAVMGADVADSM